MRDLLVAMLLMAFLMLAVKNRFVAYLLWGWAGLAALGTYLYGPLAGVPFVMIFALLTLAPMLFTAPGTPRPDLRPIWGVMFILGWMLLHGLLCASFAYPGVARNWEMWSNMAKTILFCFMMPLLVTNRARIYVMTVAVVLAIGGRGMVDGAKFIASLGAHNAHGINGVADNNHYAMMLLMVLPLAYFLAMQAASRLTRYGWLAMSGLVVLAVAATNSRGGLIGLMIFATWILFVSRHKFTGVALMAVGLAFLYVLVPESWYERMETIKEANEDESFMGRVGAWKISSAIAMANPIFGGGYRVIQSSAVSDVFKNDQGFLGFVQTPVMHISGLAAHSIWFEVIADQGFVGLLLFISLIASSVVCWRKIRALQKTTQNDIQWAVDLSNGLIGAVAIYVVTGSALSAAYFEMPYVIIMLMAVLLLIARQEALLAAPADPPPQASRRGAGALPSGRLTP